MADTINSDDNCTKSTAYSKLYHQQTGDLKSHILHVA
jgi:hypothetical protein